MFNNKKVVTYDSEAEKVVTLIGTGAVCDGPFSSKDSTRVDGTINGAVRIDGSLIIGQTGKINGNIKAQNVFLAGEVTGNVDAGAGKVEISDTGKIVGDITTHSIVIDENNNVRLIDFGMSKFEQNGDDLEELSILFH